MAHFTGETGTIYESDMLCIGENVFPATYYRDPDNGTITIRTQVESPEGLRSASGLPSIVVPKRELGKADMGVPQKVVQFQREKPRLWVSPEKWSNFNEKNQRSTVPISRMISSKFGRRKVC